MVEKKKREHGNVKNKGQKRRNKATRGMREREREREMVRNEAEAAVANLMNRN